MPKITIELDVPERGMGHIVPPNVRVLVDGEPVGLIDYVHLHLDSYCPLPRMSIGFTPLENIGCMPAVSAEEREAMGSTLRDSITKFFNKLAPLAPEWLLVRK